MAAGPATAAAGAIAGDGGGGGGGGGGGSFAGVDGFGGSLPEEYFFISVPTWAFLVAAVVEVAVVVGLILRRFARITI